MFPKTLDFRGRPVALLTKHGKAAVIAPVLAELDMPVILTEDYDTDMLGTFSGEVERVLSPLEAARIKAKLARKFTGLDIGLGSEGSFGGGPLPGLLNWDSELLVLHHAENDFEIIAQASGAVSLVPFEIVSLQDLKEKLWKHDPQQAWIIRSENHVIKALYGEDDIKGHLLALSLVDQNGRLKMPVRIEPDLRAMHCPQRQKYIHQAAKQLVERLQSCCPACIGPDFWPDGIERGLPCKDCGAPTRLPLAHIRHCKLCQHEVREPSLEHFADPGACDLCNP